MSGARDGGLFASFHSVYMSGHHKPKIDLTAGERKGLLALLCILLVIAIALHFRNGSAGKQSELSISASADSMVTTSPTVVMDSIVRAVPARLRKKNRTAEKRHSSPPVVRDPRGETLEKK